MRIRMAMRFCTILTLMGIVISSHAFAQAGKVQATIFLIGVQQPIVVQDFSINDGYFYDAVRQGKKVKLPFRDLKEIRFLNPGKSFETEVLFNDGRRETLLLQPAGYITIDTGMISQYSHTKVARIQFAPMPKQPPPPDARPGPQPPPDAASLKSDRLFLKSGDSLSGTVQTKTFPLRTAYGTFQLEATQIASIEFDTTRPSIAMVLLKNGDRLSGTIEADSVRFVMGSGEEVNFDGKTIKTIHFKR